MSDPVLAFVLLAALAIALVGAWFFRNLDPAVGELSLTPLFAGAVAGVLVRVVDAGGLLRALVTGVVLTAAALYVRLTGDRSEPADGMILGAICGAGASVPLIVGGRTELDDLAACVAAGAVAGYGITLAALHVADRLRQAAIDIVTAAAATGVASIPSLADRAGLAPVTAAAAVVAAVPLAAIITVFRQWPDLRAELRHEASLGFIDDGDVRATAHPIRRLGRGGWADPQAHREFVRVATELALRKRQQRGRPDDTARIYQLEIIKLRMQIQHMTRIDNDARALARAAERRLPSDTMHASE